MHYNNLEWTLFRSGSLSERMKQEMEEHLQHCDQCLAAYLQTIDHLEDGLPVEKPSQELHPKRNYTPFRPVRFRWAFFIAMLLVMLSLGLTPHGKIVLAQIQTSLSEFGHSLTQLFGLPDDSPYVQNIGQSQNTAGNVSFKLTDVTFTEKSFRFTANAEGVLPNNTDLWLLWKFYREDNVQPITGKTKGTHTAEGTTVFAEQANLSGSTTDTEPLHGTLWLESIGYMNENGESARIDGPWTFNFDIPSTNADATITENAGISLSLDQALLERDSLVCSFLVKGNIPNQAATVSHQTDLEINGEKFYARNQQNSTRLTDGNTGFSVITTWDLPEKFQDLSEMHLKLTVHNLQIKPEIAGNSKDTLKLRGPWIFEFDLNNDFFTNDSRIFPIQEKIELEGFPQPVTYKLDELVISPIHQYVSVTKLDAGLPKSEPLVLEPLGIFELRTENGTILRLTRQGMTLDEDGNTVYSFMTVENSFDLLKDQQSFSLTPYHDPNPTSLVPQDIAGQEAMALITVHDSNQPNESISTEAGTPAHSGIEIKLDQAILEADALWFSFLFSGALPKDTRHIEAFPTVFINDELATFSSASGSAKNLDSALPVIMTTWKLGFKDGLPEAETLQFKIRINRLRVVSDSQPDRTIEGPWEFSFETDAGELASETQTVLLNRTLNVDKAAYSIEFLTLSPLHQRIKVARYRDQQPQALTQTQQNIPAGNLKGFMILTNQGEEIAFESDRSSSENESGLFLTFEASGTQFEALKNAEKLTIIPYIAKKNWQSDEVGLKAYFPLEDEAIIIDRTMIQNEH